MATAGCGITAAGDTDVYPITQTDIRFHGREREEDASPCSELNCTAELFMNCKFFEKLQSKIRHPMDIILQKWISYLKKQRDNSRKVMKDLVLVTCVFEILIAEIHLYNILE